jgi:hypothetical protein
MPARKSISSASRLPTPATDRLVQQPRLDRRTVAARAHHLVELRA